MTTIPVLGVKPALPPAAAPSRAGWWTAAAAILFSTLSALLLPKGYGLAACADTLEAVLIAATSVLAFLNCLRSHARVRVFWFLISLGTAIWTLSSTCWGFYEIGLHRPVPSSPVVDILLFVMIVPLSAAFAAAPHRQGRSPFRAFGLIDVSVLMVFTLYLYVFGVSSYLLLPGATGEYDFRFNIADASVNHLFMICAALALLSSQGRWKAIYRLCFLAAASFALSTDLINTAIDSGRYYSGSFYDIPLVVALASLLCMTLVGRSLNNPAPEPAAVAEPDELPGRSIFVSSHLAMLAMLFTPLLGLWLLSGAAGPLLRFRLALTLATMFILGLLLSIKEDFLARGLISSLTRLSDTYVSIETFKSRLSHSEKMASLGELVADVANQIKQCMNVILGAAGGLSSRAESESRAQGMAGKIAQYAQRTDALVDNMLHFAQETPMRPALLQVKPLLESALQLSRVAKLPDVHVKLVQESECPEISADSSQVLQVFLELISNAVDALQEVNGGGSLEIKVTCDGGDLFVEFSDDGPGLKEPSRVFEPFYTTKVVGKGTGLGLSTCYGIVQQHGGEITCRNRLTGGASFLVRLPLPSKPSSGASPADSAVLEGAL